MTRWVRYKYTLTGPFISYTLLVPGCTLFCLQTCLNPFWHILWKVLKIFLANFGPHDGITQKSQVCQLHSVWSSAAVYLLLVQYVVHSEIILCRHWLFSIITGSDGIPKNALNQIMPVFMNFNLSLAHAHLSPWLSPAPVILEAKKASVDSLNIQTSCTHSGGDCPNWTANQLSQGVIWL